MTDAPSRSYVGYRTVRGIIQPALPAELLPTVIRPQVGTSPAAGGAATTAFNIAQYFVRLEAINRQLALPSRLPLQ